MQIYWIYLNVKHLSKDVSENQVNDIVLMTRSGHDLHGMLPCISIKQIDN